MVGDNGSLTPLDANALKAATRLLRDRRSVVLAGAGCSTESGIPDYRGTEGRLKTRSPVQYGAFVRSAQARRRYWARSAVGWSRVTRAFPNAAHKGLARLEQAGLVSGLITQNVDGLHHAAGSQEVIELHGSLAYVICLGCGRRLAREVMQARLLDANPSWLDESGALVRAAPAPDGDADLEGTSYGDFVLPSCDACGGVLKPDVVFFGENVPKLRVKKAWRMLDRADVLLVVGSSLTVYSGRRFVYGAVEREMPIGVLNLGPTRADEVAAVKVEGRLGEVLPQLVSALGLSPA
jgi:NAD-dependent deacetylase sirtuin 4